MRLSEFLKLKYFDRVTLLFIWCNIDDKDKQYALEYYDYDYRRIFREYFIFLGNKNYDIIEELVRRGFVIDDTVDITIGLVVDKNRGHGHAIFDVADIEKCNNENIHISSNFTTKNSKKYPASKLDFDPYLGQKTSMITAEIFDHNRSRYVGSKEIGKMSIRNYYDRLNTIRKHLKSKQ